MRIDLKGGYVITANSRNYILSKKGVGKDKEGNEVERLLSSTYYSSIHECLIGYKRRYLRGAKVESLKGLLALSEELEQYIKEQLEDI